MVDGEREGGREEERNKGMVTVSNSYAIELLKQALELYTPSKQEYPLARLIADKAASELGFEHVHIDDVGNVIARKGYGSPRVLLCGHMDTVPGYMPVSIRDGLIYGRGASDAKAPLLALLLAASLARDCGTITFAGLVDEEGNATGVKNLMRNNIDADYAIFGEPSGLEKITIAYKGRVALNITCDVGDSAHASAPMLAGNAIEEAYELWQSIKDALASMNNKGLTYCITEIKGGSSHNVTPARCSITIDIRVPNGLSTLNVLNLLDFTLNRVAGKKGIKVEYSVEDRTEAFEAKHDSPLVRALVLAVMDVRGKRPMLIRKSGTGDMNVLGNALNIPIVTYGPGDSHSSHSADEHVSIDEYIASIDVLKRTLYHLSRLHKREVGK
ncbi:MAG: M20/M25/M40 family metallo-hydrolase [Candidatus Nitrosocaldus sp.]